MFNRRNLPQKTNLEMLLNKILFFFHYFQKIRSKCQMYYAEKGPEALTWNMEKVYIRC